VLVRPGAHAIVPRNGQVEVRILTTRKEAEEETAGKPRAKTEGLVHKRRKRNGRRRWAPSDVATSLGLALLLLPAWILPERSWAPLWRALARIPLLTDQRAVRWTARRVATALGDVSPVRAQAIARDLRAAIYEIRMQDLRAWRPGERFSSQVVLEGEDHLIEALKIGKGAVLWVSPTVFYSLPTKRALYDKGYRVSHLSSPVHGYSETQFGVDYLNRVRCVPEDRYLAQRIVFDSEAPTTAMRRMMRTLKAGEVVSIVAANTEGYEMVDGPIFGGRLPVAVGAPRLAALAGAPLLPTFVVRDSELGFRVAIETPIPLDPNQSADQRTVAAATEYLRRSEAWIRRYPEQWRAWSKWRKKG
jgi:lauroyl/myristoyl acyltransferase